MSDEQRCAKCERLAPINYNRATVVPALCLDCALDFLEHIKQTMPAAVRVMMRSWLRA